MENCFQNTDGRSHGIGMWELEKCEFYKSDVNKWSQVSRIDKHLILFLKENVLQILYDDKVLESVTLSDPNLTVKGSLIDNVFLITEETKVLDKLKKIRVFFHESEYGVRVKKFLQNAGHLFPVTSDFQGWADHPTIPVTQAILQTGSSAPLGFHPDFPVDQVVGRILTDPGLLDFCEKVDKVLSDIQRKTKQP